VVVEIVGSFEVHEKPRSLSKPEVILPGAAQRIEEGHLVARASMRDRATPGGRWTRRLIPVAAVCGSLLVSACSSGGGGAPAGGGRTTTAPAPVPAPLTGGGPPPTFSRTTADLRVSKLIDVRDGLTKTALFRAATDVLSSKYSIDVSDQKAGFLMTPWQASFARAGMPDLRYRTRVIVRFVGEDWKQVLVRAEANWQRDEEWDVGVDNVLLDEVVNDIRNRIGKKPAG
jgi:hypothetical protein